jgi:hypothetical protein
MFVNQPCSFRKHKGLFNFGFTQFIHLRIPSSRVIR